MFRVQKIAWGRKVLFIQLGQEGVDDALVTVSGFLAVLDLVCAAATR